MPTDLQQKEEVAQRGQQEVDEQLAARGVWNTNYSSVQPLQNSVLDVLRDQGKRGQVLVLTQQAAKKRFPGLVVASLGAVKKEKDGVITARQFLCSLARPREIFSGRRHQNVYAREGTRWRADVRPHG